jgi:hypothetical protein
MALSLVQHTSGTVAAGTTITFTIANPAPGDLLIITATCISSSKFNTPAGFSIADQINMGTVDSSIIYYKVATGTEGTSLVYTFTSTTGSAHFAQYHSNNGPFSASPLDQINHATGAISATSLSPGSITPTVANYVVVSVLGTASSTVTAPAASGMTIEETQRGSRDMMADVIVANGSGSFSTTWSWTASTNNGSAAVIANFKEPGARVYPWVPSNNRTGPQALRNSFKYQITPWFVDSGGVVNASITQVAGTVTAGGGTQTIATVNNVAITQVAGTVTATGGTQVIATVNNVSITQTAGTVTAGGGTQTVATVNNSAITQVAGTVTAGGGTQVIATTNLVNITQVAGVVTAGGGTQAVSAGSGGAVSAAVTQVAGVVTSTGGTQVSQSSTGPVNNYPSLIFDIEGNPYLRVTAHEYLAL